MKWNFLRSLPQAGLQPEKKTGTSTKWRGFWSEKSLDDLIGKQGWMVRLARVEIRIK